MRTWLPGRVEPRYLTPIPEGAIVDLRAVKKVAALMGRRPTFYQVEILERLIARWPDGTPVFTTILVSFPRQTGKTTCIMDWLMYVAMTRPYQKLWFTAQTGMAARERFLAELVEPSKKYLEPLGIVDTKLAAGATRTVVVATGSQIRPMPPTSQYLHGGQGDKIIADEQWAFTQKQGKDLMQAVRATQLTRNNSQIVQISAAGDAESDYWHARLAKAIAEPSPRVAVIDYGVGTSADPQEVTSFTIEDVLAAHPGVAAGLCTREKVLEPLENEDMDFNEWLRAYGNVRSKNTRQKAIDLEAYRGITTTVPLDDGPVTLGVGVSWDGATTALAAVGTINQGRGVGIEIIDARPGRQWVITTAQELVRRGIATEVCGDAYGPTKRLADQLVIALPEHWKPLSTDEMIAATEDFLQALDQEADTMPIHVRRCAGVEYELDVAELRNVGEKGRMFSRRNSAAGTARLEAGLAALAGYQIPETAIPEPFIWSPE